MVNYTIIDGCIYFESDSKDNPIIPHLDGEGQSLAQFGPHYMIVEGLTVRVSGKTATLSMSGKKGSFLVSKLPVEVLIALSSALEECCSDENPINEDTLENITNCIDYLEDTNGKEE